MLCCWDFQNYAFSVIDDVRYHDMSSISWSTECRLAKVGGQYGAIPSASFLHARFCATHCQRSCSISRFDRCRFNTAGFCFALFLLNLCEVNSSITFGFLKFSLENSHFTVIFLSLLIYANWVCKIPLKGVRSAQ